MCAADARAEYSEYCWREVLMPAWILPAAIAGGQAIAGAVGQSSANAANRKEAKRGRDFAERMSGTAYRRSKVDMEAAGLNPALMYGSGKSGSTPSGPVATNQQSISKELGTGVSSALAVKRLGAELELLQAQVKKTKAEGMSAEAKGYFDLDEWLRANTQGEGGPGYGGRRGETNPRNLQRLFEAKFDVRINEAEAGRLNNILRRYQQPGGEANAQIWAEISKMDPKVRAGLIMLLGATGRQIPIGGR